MESCLLRVWMDMGEQDHILPPRLLCQISVLTWVLDLRTQRKPNELWAAECCHPLVRYRAGRATHSPCTGHKLQLQYSSLPCFWQPNAHNLISARTHNSERGGSEFCIYYSCLLENKDITVTLVFFQAFRSICNFKDMLLRDFRSLLQMAGTPFTSISAWG